MNPSKLLVLVTLAILTLHLAACGGAPDGESIEAEPTTTGAEPAATTAPAEPTATTEQVEPTATVAPADPTPTAVESETDNGSEEPEQTEEGEVVSAGDPDAGAEHFSQVCSACHGPGGEGIEGLGKDLTTSEFVAGLSDQELLAFIQEGRPVDHPDNTTGVEMPPRGGNPDFSDEQLLDIIAYIRTLQEE